MQVQQNNGNNVDEDNRFGPYFNKLGIYFCNYIKYDQGKIISVTVWPKL